MDHIRNRLNTVDNSDIIFHNEDSSEQLDRVISAFIDEMPAHFIIRDLLSIEKMEVIGMLYEEFDEAEYNKAMMDYAKAKEAEAVSRGLAKGLSQGKSMEHAEGLQTAAAILKPVCTTFEKLYRQLASYSLY